MIKPPIFWKDKPVIKEQSKKWSGEKLNKVCRSFTTLKLVLTKHYS